jgi:prepilin-type N-terminal cleavage/methylation domain-containing protein
MIRRPGFSLIELLVTLVLIGITAAVASIAMRSPRDSGTRQALADARREAIRTGRIVTGYTDSSGAFSAYPQGVVVTDSQPRVRLSARSDAR